MMLTAAADATTAKGFETLDQEVVIDEVPVEGTLPDWLEGTLIRNGPAKFDAGVRHWLDGMAMLHRFTVRDGRVSYANRYLRTKAFAAAQEGRVGYREFASDPCRTLFKRVTSVFDPGFTDNAAVNVLRAGEEFVAMTETPMAIRFDPSTLETLGVAAPAPGMSPTAHPHVDKGEVINAAVHFGPRSSYVTSTLAPGGTWRKQASVGVREPGYLHSFGLTERFVVLVLGPLTVNPLRLATSDRPFIENYRWHPERGTDVIAIDRATGDLAGRWTAEPLWLFHHINAFEDGDELVLDVCAYDDPAVLDALYLDKVRARIDGLPTATPRRMRVALGGGTPTVETIADVALELPRIDERRNTRPYRVTWGISGFDAITRVDVETGEHHEWREEGFHPGEPVFVADPQAAGEGEGVLLSVVLDGRAGRSFLLVLDATSLAEVARARLPHHVPFGFHGHFYDV